MVDLLNTIEAAHPGDYAFAVAKHIGANFRSFKGLPRLFYSRDMVVEGELPPLHVACAFGTAAEALPLIAIANAEELWHAVIVRGKEDACKINFEANVYTAGRCARERLGLCSDARLYRTLGGCDPFPRDQDHVSEALDICNAIKNRAVELCAPWGDLTTFDLKLLDCAPGVLLSLPQTPTRERRASSVDSVDSFFTLNRDD